MSKVRDLPEVTSLEDSDLLYAVDSSEGTNGGRKITKSNLKQSVKQSDAEIKTAYENNADTNAFTDADKTKLDGIEAGATADQDSEEVPYDNNISGLDATNVKAGLDELQAEKENAFIKNSAFNKDFGTTADTVVEGNDARLSTVQKVTVKKNPGAGQFSSIKAAVDSISDASISKPYQVNIGPGVYVEDTISVPAFVHLRGEREATVVQALDNNNDIFIIGSNCSVAQLRVEGATGAGAAAFRRTGGVTESEINLIEFGDNTNLVVLDSTAGAPTIVVNSCRISSNTEFVNGFSISGSGAGTLIINNLTGVILGTGNNPTNCFLGTGATNKLIVIANNIRVEAPASLENGVLLQDGIQCFISALNLIGPTHGINVENTGVGPDLTISGLTVKNALTNSILVNNPNTTGFMNGAWNFEKMTLDQTASENVSISFNEVENSDLGLVALGDILQGIDKSSLLNISKLNREEATLGLIEGGGISNGVGPLEVTIAAGTGFLSDSNGNSQEISWEATNLFMPADTARQVTVNENGIVQLEASEPTNFEERIILGRVITGDVSVVRIENSPVVSRHHGNLIERYLRRTFGAIFASGSIVSENGSTDRALDVTAGEYYYGSSRFAPVGGTEIVFSRIIRDGSGDFTTEAIGATTIPNNQYDDNSGGLVAIPAGEYAKGVLLLDTDGAFEGYTYVFAQQTFANLNDVIAADLPQLPAEVGQTLTPIAAIIVQEGQANFEVIEDIRPRPSFAAGSSGAASDHGGLTGLADDDHPQYLLTNGGRALTGNLNMGANNITNVGTVDGIDVTNHGSRHLPNGADPLTTAAPLTNLNGNTANSIGTANSLSRSDHTHEIDNATGAVAGLMSAADKSKLDGVESGATADQNSNEVPYNNAGSTLAATDVESGLDELDGRLVANEAATQAHVNGGPNKHDASEVDYERADESKSDIQASSDNVETALTDLDDNKLSRTGNQAMTGNLDMGSNNITNVGTVDGVDVSAHGSRHNPGGADPVATAAPAANLTATTANQEGTATSLARSDHSHNIDTAAPSSNLTGDTPNQEGTATSLSRADHSHAINTGAPSSALSATTTNQEGTDANLARADHSHDISTGTVSTQTPAQSNAEGTSANLARADHTHNLPVGTPSNVGAANAEGVANVFARQDHVHNVFPAFERVYAENNAIATTTSGTFQQALTANIVVPAGGGDYEISWSYEWNMDTTGNDFLGRVQVDNSTTLMEHQQEPQDSGGGGIGGSNQSMPASGFAQVTLTAGSHDIDLDYASGDGFSTAAIRRRRLKIVRVA